VKTLRKETSDAINKAKEYRKTASTNTQKMNRAGIELFTLQKNIDHEFGKTILEGGEDNLGMISVEGVGDVLEGETAMEVELGRDLKKLHKKERGLKMSMTKLREAHKIWVEAGDAVADATKSEQQVTRGAKRGAKRVRSGRSEEERC